ncbi:cysteine peptidase family C39 domain-containing protein [Catalinimonas niigatensis]|uniref:cysteine peptidase family C39 domain-containing protein n=1 Tax=Catalinimonas niigatensis TaxID=1397264 RepID=UPI0026669100|nr:papain-like cysteine protease family protein [Catalinimonas niigatensis]WPP49746.1 papain-like cysteine protease family protein [Catalinimonas niigatensis]
MKTISLPKVLFLISLLCSLGVSQGYAQIRPQENSMWCWASCIQSALDQANVYQSQSQIVARLTGYPQNRPAHINEVVQLLQSYRFRAWSVDYPASPEQLYSTLASGWKLIAFVNPTDNPSVGHFIILQKIATNNLIVVSDPANGQTYVQHPEVLYKSWKWSRSIVVGTPA